MRVILINTNKNDDWIRSPKVTKKHAPDKDLKWRSVDKDAKARKFKQSSPKPKEG